MESKLNADIRKVLERFGVEVGEVKGSFSIIGHLVQVAKKYGAEQ